MINILILSAGTRNKVVQYFRKELAGRGKVYATDCSELAPAVYEADEAIFSPAHDGSGISGNHSGYLPGKENYRRFFLSLTRN